jgi:hypothetical protein
MLYSVIMSLIVLLLGMLVSFLCAVCSSGLEIREYGHRDPSH